jgi:hypothetical protein
VPEAAQRRSVRPLQIVDCDDGRSFEAVMLVELGNTFDDPELGGALIDQEGDLGARRIRG